MSTTKRRLMAIALVLAAVVWGLWSLATVTPTPTVQAAVITPVAQTARGAESARVAQYFYSQRITQDTRVCFDLKDYETVDLQYQVDATLANATTVKLQQTNIDPVNGPFNDAQTVATVSTPTDANTMTQLGLFGRWNCVLADVTNSNPITFTVVGVAK